jgi:hypothetical protein
MDSLRRLRALARPDSAGILGEQGGQGGIADIDRHLTYLTQLKRLTQAALERGEVEGATAIEVLEFVGTPGYAEYHALNRQRVWRELEQAWFK